MNEERLLRLLEKLSRYLSNYRQRAGQQQMAVATGAAIETGKSLVVEGGTGVGKSMAYLLPALMAVSEKGARSLIATSHKPLQDQISKKDVPVVAQLLKEEGKRPIKWVTLKGLSNYFCWHSADEEQGKIAVDPIAAKVIRYAAAASRSEFNGDFEELPFDVPPDTRALLSATSEDCLSKKCPQFSRCYAFKMREEAEEADVVITNHSLLTLDIQSEGMIIPGQYAFYVIDEGHNFEDNATKANGLTVTLGACRRFLNSDAVKTATKIATARIETARTNYERLQQAIIQLWSLPAEQNRFKSSGGNEDENKRLLKTEMPSGLTLADDIKGLAALIRAVPPKTDEEGARLQRMAKQGLSLAERLEKICAIGDPNLVYYAERLSYNPVEPRRRSDAAAYAINAMPIDVSGYLEKWFNENTVIVTSATLSDGQNFDFFKKRVGLHNADTLIVPSPFDYAGRVRLFFPRTENNGANGGKTYATLTEQIAQLINTVPDGRILALFTSYAALDYVWRRLNDHEEFRLNPQRPLFRQGESQMQRIISNFQDTSNGVIFGTRSWWQGVDLPGMRLLIIDKLPFPQLNDPIINARNQDIDTRGGSSFNEFMLPMALITFRQGAGRLMRQENDRGVIVVCDERIVRQRYGARFIKSLSANIPVLGSIKDLHPFLESFD
ncbi:ATP-dependent DNA helicase [Candidatus Chlorohelix sp.]|uniref:ATP-dependent DNA helicase n=1 Tax=Candidatus Chlorohelix sp. TaxID=3139201 RepID=UPI0030381555